MILSEQADNGMKIYTARGDEGFTDTIVKRGIPKSDLSIHLLGTLDEFTSTLGQAKALLHDEMVCADIDYIQKSIIRANAQIAGGFDFLDDNKIEEIEVKIDGYQRIAGSFKGFILPGNNSTSATLDVARTVIRRAERIAVDIKQNEGIDRYLLIFLNRLSDLAYVMARYVDAREEIKKMVQNALIQEGYYLDKGNLTSEVISNHDRSRMPTNSMITKAGVSSESRLTLDRAKCLAEAIEKEAMKLNASVVIAIADESANIMLLHRMEESFIASIDIATNKAYTSAALKMTTEVVGKLSEQGSPLYGLQFTNNGRIVVFAGGVPLKDDFKLYGALGVSGGTAEQDKQLAEFGANLFGRE